MGGSVVRSLANVLETLPECSKNCTIAANAALVTCNLDTRAELAACLCPNESQLRKITECVQNSCTYPDWEIIHTAHTMLCEGFPIPERTTWFRTVAIALLSLTVPFIVLRIYSRVLVTRLYGWDDYTFIVASFFSTATMIIMFPLASLDFGVHYWDINLSNVAPIGILFYVAQLNYVFVQILSKVSILLFFLRIFSLEKFIRIGSYLLLLFLALKGIIFFFIVIFQCTPVASTWDRSIPGTCVNTRVLTILAAALGILEDLATLCLPIPCITSLNMNRSKKVNAILMFSIGSIATILSIIRIKFLLSFGSRVDTTYEDLPAFAWSVIENSLALICACLPAMRPILSMVWPVIFGSLSSDGTPGVTPQHSQRPRSMGHFELKDMRMPDDQKWECNFETVTSDTTSR